MKGRTAFAVLALMTIIASAPLLAQDDEKKKPPPASTDCVDGTLYDDKKLEDAVRPVVFDDNFVMLFEAPSSPATLEKLCIFWRKTSFWNRVWFDVRIWAADGPDGAPGTLLAVIPTLTAGRIPPKGKFYSYDVRGHGVVIDQPVYIGPFWDPLDAFLIYLGVDYGPKTPRRRAFFNTGVLDDHPPQTELGLTISTLPRYRALGIRAKFGPP